MLEGARVIAVVPAFEEAERIAGVVSSVPACVDRIVVVDDASLDGTAERARATGEPRLEVIIHEKNRGVGAAIVTGYRRALQLTEAPRDVFVVMAGDGQMDPEDLPQVVSPVASGRAGYVKGNRFASPHAWRVMPLQRRIGGEVFSRLTARAIGIPISDSQCGYTAISRDACEALDFEALWPRYGYPNDLLAKLTRAGVAIEEVTVRPVYAGEKSHLRVWHLARIAQLVARAWLERTRSS
jgi:glycosyltransferase involved in cell wall biosynthesis